MKAKLLAKKMLLLISLGVCTDAATQMLPRYFSFVTQESITAIPQEFVF